MEYPYIQNKQKIEKGICSVCKIEKPILRLEWRVDWFQGNCEFEEICQSCFIKRESEERKQKQVYFKKMEPIWEKQRQKHEGREKIVKNIINELGLELKEYSNGQWAIGNKIDWWTSTGTAIERKSRKQHYFSLKEPQKIRETLIQLLTNPQD